MKLRISTCNYFVELQLVADAFVGYAQLISCSARDYHAIRFHAGGNQQFILLTQSLTDFCIILAMRRRPRIDLGQQVNLKEESRLERKRERWAARNKDRPQIENPFLAAIKPEHANYGDPTENREELRSRLENLEFGNFPGYFNYRKNAVPKDGEKQCSTEPNQTGCDHPTNPLEDGLSDERLSSMKAEWFANKEVLDIGCNRGHITYAIARVFSPKFILGIDIDLRMINMANRDLHLHLEDGVMKQGEVLRRQHAASLRLRDDSVKVYEECPNHFPQSSYVAQGPIAVLDSDGKAHFPNNILFIEHNYVLACDDLAAKQKPHFDTILCLSVTKWIHLNYRDDGLKRFFKRIYNHLKPGGLLVLEAQPFDNYGRRKKLSDRLRANYYSIQFKPDQFDDFLLSSEVGFKEIVYSTTTDHKCTGFKRPLKVFAK